MPARRIYPDDPADPDFPHGTRYGYDHGCLASRPCPATPTCANAYTAAQRAYRRRHRIYQAMYRPDTVRAYVQSYLDKGWTAWTYAKAADVNDEALGRILNGKTTKMTTAMAHKLLRVDEDMLYEASDTFVPAHLVRWKLGSLCANGITCAAQADMLGYTSSVTTRIVKGLTKHVRKETAEDIGVLFDKMRSVRYIARHSAQAVRTARKYGFRTPDAYAPDGTLWEDDVRDERREERWARRDRESLLRMRVAHLSLTRNLGLYAITVHLGMDDEHGAGEQAVRRARAALGLKWNGGKLHGPKPGQEDRINEILKVVERWRQAGPLADPHPFCVELGMMDAHIWTSLDGKPRLEAA